MVTKKKITKHVVGPVLDLIAQWQMKMVQELSLFTAPEVHGIIFSNDGARGRKSLFDASKNKTGDIFAYWEDIKKGTICITAKEAGYEVKAPKNMDYFFAKCIYYPTKSYGEYDFGEHINFLDVTHLNVDNSTSFRYCFKHFAKGCMRKGSICGLETWDMSKATDLSGMFKWAFDAAETVNFDLSNWRFSEKLLIDVSEMFDGFAQTAEVVKLNLKWWNTSGFYNYYRMFQYFANKSEEVHLYGIEDWCIKKDNVFDYMFLDFAPWSQCHLDLSKWSEDGALTGTHFQFATNTFFKIKEPAWAD